VENSATDQLDLVKSSHNSQKQEVLLWKRNFSDLHYDMETNDQKRKNTENDKGIDIKDSLTNILDKGIILPQITYRSSEEGSALETSTLSIENIPSSLLSVG